jgi:hypothetical protein
MSARGQVREGGGGRDPTLKNTGVLMPAAKYGCLWQNLKVVAQRTRTLLQGEEQWRCTCAHPERGEAEERGRWHGMVPRPLLAAPRRLLRAGRFSLRTSFDATIKR